jgi:hypothetical protein
MELSPRLKRYLEKVPEELWSVLATDDTATARKLEESYDKLGLREEKRDLIMKTQRQLGLPLRPNESAARLATLAKLKELKRRRDPIYDPEDKDDQETR